MCAALGLIWVVGHGWQQAGLAAGPRAAIGEMAPNRHCSDVVAAWLLLPPNTSVLDSTSSPPLLLLLLLPTAVPQSAAEPPPACWPPRCTAGRWAPAGSAEGKGRVVQAPVSLRVCGRSASLRDGKDCRWRNRHTIQAGSARAFLPGTALQHTSACAHLLPAQDDAAVVLAAAQAAAGRGAEVTTPWCTCNSAAGKDRTAPVQPGIDCSANHSFSLRACPAAMQPPKHLSWQVSQQPRGAANQNRNAHLRQ